MLKRYTILTTTSSFYGQEKLKRVATQIEVFG